MEIIGLQSSPSVIDIVMFIHSLFPEKELINWQGDFEKTFIYNGIENIEKEEIASNFSGFSVQVEPNESEYKTVVTLFRTCETDSKKRELFLAIKLSERFHCKTIINGSEELVIDPYFSLIIDQGKIYEADDSGTIWGDGFGAEVKIVKELKLRKPDFDKKGNLIN